MLAVESRPSIREVIWLMQVGQCKFGMRKEVLNGVVAVIAGMAVTSDLREDILLF